jgi:hypothetical protein
VFIELKEITKNLNLQENLIWKTLIISIRFTYIYFIALRF